jgi:hypothetical protein
MSNSALGRVSVPVPRLAGFEGVPERSRWLGAGRVRNGRSECVFGIEGGAAGSGVEGSRAYRK